jgi:small subunit ribosomal protein S9
MATTKTSNKTSKTQTSAKKPAKPADKKPAVKKPAAVKKTVAKKPAVKKPVNLVDVQTEPSLPVITSTAPMVIEAQAEEAEELIIPEQLAIAGKSKYFQTVGRRKTASARARLYTQGSKEITVNGKPCEAYFKLDTLQKQVISPLQKINCLGKFGVSLLVRGGGLSGQAQACCHAIARALVLLNPYFKKRLKKSGLLTRDSRMRERKKPGLKRARRAPQWSKR